MDYKIFSYLDQIIDAYQEPVSILNGLTFNHKETLRTIEFYSNSQYLSGNKDALGREKPFYNIGNYRVTVAKTATDLDVKDIKYEPDSLEDSIPAMLINHELFKFLKEINFSKTINDMGLTRPKYGGLLVKKYEEGEDISIEVVDWKNVDVDPVDIRNGIIIETHYLLPSQLAAKKGYWENVPEVLKEFAKMNKNKPGRIEIKEISGEMPVSFYKQCEDDKYKETEDDKGVFKRCCFYIACLKNKKYLLHYEYEKKSKYKYLEWEYVPGRGLGRGIIEDGFEAQTWTNDAMISAKNVMDLTSKVLIQTTSKKVANSGNVVTGVNIGHIFELEPNASMSAINLGPSKFPEIQNMVDMWNTQYDRSSSTYNANTGESPTAGTPYSQTALLNQVANSPFEFQREVWGIFLNEILNDWVLPVLKKRILKKHYLVSEFGDDDLKIIDDSIRAIQGNTYEDEMLMKGFVPSPLDMQAIDESVTQALHGQGKKREIEIPEGYLDIDGKITANITGELKNKAATLQSLDSIFKTVISTYNPNTGEYAALKDPILSKIFGQIIEISGVQLSSAQLMSTPNKPSQMSQSQPTADVSAIQPEPTLTA